jgi:hypothetical protein
MGCNAKTMTKKWWALLPSVIAKSVGWVGFYSAAIKRTFIFYRFFSSLL